MGDRIVVMKDGVMQQVDTPLEIYENPANRFVASFIGSPPMNFFTGSLVSDANGLFFTNDTMSVKVADQHAQILNARGSQDIVLGVRPENIQDSVLQSNPDPDTLVSSKVEVVEPMGAEVMLYLSVGGNPFIARVDGKDQATAGQELKMSLDMSTARFFEPGAEGVRIA